MAVLCYYPCLPVIFFATCAYGLYQKWKIHTLDSLPTEPTRRSDYPRRKIVIMKQVGRFEKEQIKMCDRDVLKGGSKSGRKRKYRRLAQEQSPLFSKLPREIRQMIYKDTLGRNKITLATFIKRGKCRVGRLVHEDLLGLVRSCHRAYAEAFDLLYTCNTFFAIEALIPAILSTRIPLHNFQLISTLDILFSFTPTHLFRTTPHMSTREQYNFAWKSLAEMRGLSDLKVYIVSTRYDWDAAGELAFLAPATAVVEKCNLAKFEIYLPYGIDPETVAVIVEGHLDLGDAVIKRGPTMCSIELN